MFTGIIETLGKVVSVKKTDSNVEYEIKSTFLKELKVDQSIAHNGVCLTVTRITDDAYFVTAVDETLKKTNLRFLNSGDYVNLERSMIFNGRIDGPLVQGHVDQTGQCVGIEDQNGSWEYIFEYDPSLGNITVAKGSICVNGVSLTVVKSQPGLFSVVIIPFTYEHTTFQYIKIKDVVNLEFDVIGKYVSRLLKGYL